MDEREREAAAVRRLVERVVAEGDARRRRRIGPGRWLDAVLRRAAAQPDHDADPWGWWGWALRHPKDAALATLAGLAADVLELGVIAASVLGLAAAVLLAALAFAAVALWLG